MAASDVSVRESKVQKLMSDFDAITREQAEDFIASKFNDATIGQMNVIGKQRIEMKVKKYMLNNRPKIHASGLKELRFVLLGSTGSGKSSAGNLILGIDKFTESIKTKSCTKHIQDEECSFDGITIRIIDTPGFNDTDRSADDIITEIAKTSCQLIQGEHSSRGGVTSSVKPIRNSNTGINKVVQPICQLFTAQVADTFCDGIHGFLYVHNIASPRFTKDQQEVFAGAADMFKGSFMAHCFMILTHGDSLQGTLDEYITWEQDSVFGKVLKETLCERVIALEKNIPKYGHKLQRKNILDTLSSWIPVNDVYDCGAFKKCREAKEEIAMREVTEHIRSLRKEINRLLSKELEPLPRDQLCNMSGKVREEVCNRVLVKMNAYPKNVPEDKIRKAIADHLDAMLKRLTTKTTELMDFATPLVGLCGSIIAICMGSKHPLARYLGVPGMFSSAFALVKTYVWPAKK